jgi:hypothetical protein
MKQGHQVGLIIAQLDGPRQGRDCKPKIDTATYHSPTSPAFFIVSPHNAQTTHHPTPARCSSERSRRSQDVPSPHATATRRTASRVSDTASVRREMVAGVGYHLIHRLLDELEPADSAVGFYVGRDLSAHVNQAIHGRAAVNTKCKLVTLLIANDIGIPIDHQNLPRYAAWPGGFRADLAGIHAACTGASTLAGAAIARS